VVLPAADRGAGLLPQDGELPNRVAVPQPVAALRVSLAGACWSRGLFGCLQALPGSAHCRLRLRTRLRLRGKPESLSAVRRAW